MRLSHVRLPVRESRRLQAALLALEFDGLVPAHGDAMLTGARDTLSRSVAQLWNR